MFSSLILVDLKDSSQKKKKKNKELEQVVSLSVTSY